MDSNFQHIAFIGGGNMASAIIGGLIRQGHRPEDLLGVALAAGGNPRLGMHPRPGLVQGGALAEGRLVLVNDYAPFAVGFFLWVG